MTDSFANLETLTQLSFSDFCSRKKYQWIFAEKLPTRLSKEKVNQARDFAVHGGKFVAEGALTSEQKEILYNAYVRLLECDFGFEEVLGQSQEAITESLRSHKQLEQYGRIVKLRKEVKTALGASAFGPYQSYAQQRIGQQVFPDNVLYAQDLDFLIKAFGDDLQLPFTSEINKISIGMDLDEFVSKVKQNTSEATRYQIYSGLIISAGLWEDKDFLKGLCKAIAESESSPEWLVELSGVLSIRITFMSKSARSIVVDRMAELFVHAIRAQDEASLTLFDDPILTQLLDQFIQDVPFDVFVGWYRRGSISEETLKKRIETSFPDEAQDMWAAFKALGNIPQARRADVFNLLTDSPTRNHSPMTINSREIK